MRGADVSLITFLTWCIYITLFVLSIMATLAIIKIPSKLDEINHTLTRLHSKKNKSDAIANNKPWEE